MSEAVQDLFHRLTRLLQLAVKHRVQLLLTDSAVTARRENNRVQLLRRQSLGHMLKRCGTAQQDSHG